MSGQRARRSRYAAVRRLAIGSSFAKVMARHFAELGRDGCGHTSLMLELIRVSGLKTVRQADGWTYLSTETLKAIGLQDKDVRHRAVQRAVNYGWITTRCEGPGCRLEYRLAAHLRTIVH